MIQFITAVVFFLGGFFIAMRIIDGGSAWNNIGFVLMFFGLAFLLVPPFFRVPIFLVWKLCILLLGNGTCTT